MATALPAVAPLIAFPFCLPQGKSPALCQREGTEGRECKYFSPAKLKPTFAEIGGGIDLAMLVATPHRKLFPFVGGFKRKEYVLARGIGYCAPCGRSA